MAQGVGNNNNNPQQQQMAQMGGNPYGGYHQQQQHRTSMNMNMQGNTIGNPAQYMHQGQGNLPNQHHRNSMPPPMNMGHQYPNQGGYNNPQQQNNSNNMQQYGQQQNNMQQYGQQHGYNPQAQMQMSGQQQQMQNVQQQMQQMQRQNSGNYSMNGQQGHPSQQQSIQPQQYGQQNSNNKYVRQASNTSRTGSTSVNPSQSDGQSSSTGGPLNFNTVPSVNGVGGLVPGGLPGPGGDYGQQFLPSGLNGDWQSDNDMHHRREMIQHM